MNVDPPDPSATSAESCVYREPVRWLNPRSMRNAHALAHNGESGPRGHEERARAGTVAASRPDVDAASAVREAHLRFIGRTHTVGNVDELTAVQGAVRKVASKVAAVGVRVAGLGPKQRQPVVHPAAGGAGGGAAAGRAIAALPTLPAAPAPVLRSQDKIERRALRAHALTLGTLLTVYRRSARGIVRLMLTSAADQMTRSVSMVLAPPYSATQWARISPATAHLANLGKVLPTLALAAHRQGVGMPGCTEGFTTQPCGRCGHCEPRGTVKRIDCVLCGAQSARDFGGAPGNIMLRNAVHAVQAYAACSVRAAEVGVG